MKHNFILVLSLFIISCSQNNKESERKQICDLNNLNDSIALNYKDFTLYNVDEIEKDSEGTEWKKPTNDEYRFVIQDAKSNYSKGIFDGCTLLVYKNQILLKKISDVNYLCTRYVPLDFSKCNLDWLKLIESLDVWIEEQNTSGKKQTDEEFKKQSLSEQLDNLPRTWKTKKQILGFTLFKENCRCTVAFYLSNNITISGEFKIHPEVGQVCK